MKYTNAAVFAVAILLLSPAAAQTNPITLQGQVGPPLRSVMPDLHIPRVYVTDIRGREAPLSAEAGGRTYFGLGYRFCYVVANRGTAASGPFTVSRILSEPHAVLEAFGPPHLEHASLAAGESRTRCFGFLPDLPQFASNLPWGSFHVYADSLRVVRERHEDNNRQGIELTTRHYVYVP